MQKLVKASFYLSISLCIVTILVIIATYFYVKPSLPKINLVDESELQMPMKIFTKDGKLIGEFGEIKRRATDYDDIPINITAVIIDEKGKVVVLDYWGTR